MSERASDDDVETTDQASTAEDLAQAKQILALLGGPNGKCKGCHTATPENIRSWGNAMRAVETACFAPTSLTAAQRVACLRPSPTSPFSPRKLGLYAAGATSTQFATLFPSTAAHATFVQQAGMPRSGARLSTTEFALVKGWVLRGMPQLDAAASSPADAGAEADSGSACVETITPALATHVNQMRTQGWGARLADLATPMLGCGTSTNPLSCLASMPDVAIGAPGITQKIKKLRELSFDSHYWVRSSADGRWVGFGLNTSARVMDLSKPITAAPIVVAADYDPVFLPSNDGFAFAGAHADSAIHVCRQSLLTDVSTQTSPSISLGEPKCTKLGTEVYQSIGSALDGSRYFVTYGAHENDDGAHLIVRPLPAAFGASATSTFVPMVNDGAAYRAGTPTVVATPGEGDLMLSPSTLLAATRTSTSYRIRFVKAQVTGTTAAVQTPLAATICLQGAKAAFSFDERFIATHQYAATGSALSNIVVVDLLTGKKRTITQMPAGQFALYPHFRADGWLYFLVRDRNSGAEYVAASDAVVRFAAGP